MLLSLKYQLKTWLHFWGNRKVLALETGQREVLFGRKLVHEKVNEIINGSHQNTKAIVITPTTGRKHLKKAIESVQKQDYPNIRHLIVIDGAEYWEASQKIIQQFDNDRIDVLLLPHNTGKNGMNGHRIYAAMPFLINAKFVFFLDQDNWYEPNHVSTMVACMEQNELEWTFAMRRIYTENEAFVTEDNCESIGDYFPYSQLPPLIDTNCYGFRRSTLVKSAHHWYHPLKADRYFFHHLKKEAPRFKSTGQYTVNYRLTENRAPFPTFFEVGNRFMKNKYGGILPWKHIS